MAECFGNTTLNHFLDETPWSPLGTPDRPFCWWEKSVQVWCRVKASSLRWSMKHSVHKQSSAEFPTETVVSWAVITSHPTSPAARISRSLLSPQSKWPRILPIPESSSQPATWPSFLTRCGVVFYPFAEFCGKFNSACMSLLFCLFHSLHCFLKAYVYKAFLWS